MPKHTQPPGCTGGGGGDNKIKHIKRCRKNNGNSAEFNTMTNVASVTDAAGVTNVARVTGAASVTGVASVTDADSVAKHWSVTTHISQSINQTNI